MVNFEIISEKSKVVNAESEFITMLSIIPYLKKEKKAKRQALNLSFAIDISGSMSLPLKQNEVYNPYVQPNIIFTGTQIGGVINNGMNVLNNAYYHNVRTKIQQACEAMHIAIRAMKDGDRVSIILFDDKVKTLCPSVVLNSESRVNLHGLINTIKTYGNTNLYAGWLESAQEVAKHLSNDTLNRIILLTDGQTNSGLTITDSICDSVRKIFNTNISTSTFGIGEQFNEDLLAKMAESGNGNFHYIDDDGKLVSMFEQEFEGINNLVGNNCQLSFIPENGVEILDNLNDFIKENNHYLIPTLTHQKNINVLLKMKAHAHGQEFKLGTFKLDYTDLEGQKHSISQDYIVQVGTQEEVNALTIHPELNVQKAILEIAREKKVFTHYIDQHDITGAKTYFSGVAGNYASIDDVRVQAEVANLNNVATTLTSNNSVGLRKSMVSESYQTRNFK
jgi:Ca-activated chloride channel homolog